MRGLGTGAIKLRVADTLAWATGSRSGVAAARAGEIKVSTRPATCRSRLQMNWIALTSTRARDAARTQTKRIRCGLPRRTCATFRNRA